jgi:hypothetical protein
MTPRQALTWTPEVVEVEPAAARQELFRELARNSQGEAGQPARQAVLFVMSTDGELVAAPGLDARADLLSGSPADAGQTHLLSFPSAGTAQWPEERRESLQGLSEREVAELVARSLLSAWSVRPRGVVQVDRAPGAVYAAAYVDGILRLNPSFLYLAASVGQ